MTVKTSLTNCIYNRKTNKCSYINTIPRNFISKQTILTQNHVTYGI